MSIIIVIEKIIIIMVSYKALSSSVSSSSSSLSMLDRNVYVKLFLIFNVNCFHKKLTIGIHNCWPDSVIMQGLRIIPTLRNSLKGIFTGCSIV